MPSHDGSHFRLDEYGLQASALRAQVLERCRRTLRHDINNAVQSLHSGLELLSKCVASPGVARVTPENCVALLQQQLVTLRQTLERMVADISEPAADPETFDFSNLTSEALELLRHERAAAKAKTNIEADVSAHARRVNIRTAVLALLLDAIDHTPSDGAIQVDVSRRGHQAFLEIRSARALANAAEISASPLMRMLRALLAEERSELEVREVEEGIIGTAVCLPSPAEDTAKQRSRNDPARVLIADRNRDAADSLAMILQLEGMRAQTHYEGSRLPEVLASFAPDVALIDLDLPGCDVYEIARRVRERSEGRPLLAQVSSTDRVKHDAFDAHLLRPVEWPQLQALIARAMGRLTPSAT